MLIFFMNLKNNFIKLPLFQKIKLYLIIVIVYIFIFYIYDEYYSKNKTANINTNNNYKSIKNIQSIKSKITKKDNSNLIKLIENKSELFNCFIHNIKATEENINLSVKGKLNNIINFLNFLQNHFNVVQFNLKYEQNILFSTISLDTKYFYNSNKIYSDIATIPNPFVNRSKLTSKKMENQTYTFKIEAIIDSNIFINNRWYKLNDTINGKRIIAVTLNTVKLIDLKTSQVSMLKVYNERR